MSVNENLKAAIMSLNLTGLCSCCSLPPRTFRREKSKHEAINGDDKVLNCGGVFGRSRAVDSSLEGEGYI